ncbi:MAG: SDR family oxidoreductase [Planctomycetia bacterium]|nr:SDR family oxidoreductase [Planctomycetia bacterium]
MNNSNRKRSDFHRLPQLDHSKYIFLTGSTGMLGSYFLRELLASGRKVVTLVRPTRKMKARERVDSILSIWENDSFHILRPVIIEGDLTGQNWLETDAQWIRENVDTVIHSAASLEFYGKRNEEPYRTNLEGLKTILDLCQRAGIQKFHHISTAYVAGSNPFFLETQCDVGQKFRNDYEQSKIEAEKMVRNFGFRSLTVYRPSIVIGDTQNGYTATLSGLYAALKLVHTLVSQLSLGATSAKCAISAMGMKGPEVKNLVPVDWVAKVFMYIFTHEELHGQTYHLTNPNPPQMNIIAKTIQEAVEHYSVFAPENEQPPCDENWFKMNFSGQMRLFRAYLQEDSHFDSSNTQKAVPHLPCPSVDHDLLMFLFQKIIESRFGRNWNLNAH